MKKLTVFLSLFLCVFAIGKGLYFLKKGFSIRHIQPISRWVETNWDEKTAQILEQPFHYLARGRQCFAFVSEDNQYILKLPRTDIYKTPFWLRALPLHRLRIQKEQRHQKRENFILNSFQISMSELQDQTALIALHLGQSFPSGKTITLIDSLGSTFYLPLEKTVFALQKKQSLLIPIFLDALQKGDREKGEKIINALLQAIGERAKKGVLNRDRSFLRNYGYDGEKAYQIDIGSFFKKPELAAEKATDKSIRDSTDPIREWLEKHAPEMVPYFNEQVNIQKQLGGSG